MTALYCVGAALVVLASFLIGFYFVFHWRNKGFVRHCPACQFFDLFGWR
jgi:hypothetical protein